MKKILMQKKGFTLVEFLMSVVVAILILGGVVMALIYLTVLSTSNKKEAVVFEDMQAVMERISGTQLINLNAQFPDGQTLPADFVANVLGGYKLPGETITVSYPNGAAANPREVLVAAAWPDRGTARTNSMRTFRRG